MTRRETIVQLLSEWEELQALAGAGGGGGDGRVPLRAHARGCGVYSSLRCTCWLHALGELERVLRALRSDEPRLWSHLRGRYLELRKVRRRHLRYRAGRWEGLEPHSEVLVPAFVPGQTSGRRDGVWENCLVAVWADFVDPGLVESALTWVEARLKVEPQLPVEALEAEWSAARRQTGGVRA